MSATVPGTAPVVINFDGVLVTRRDSTSKVCEVGVLPSPDHEFFITVEEEGPAGSSKSSILFESIAQEDRIWTLEVPNRDPNTELFITGDIPDRNTFPGTERERKNFKWVPDLESAEFRDHLPKPGDPLPMHSGLLKPIIHVKTGLFYTSLLPRRTTVDRRTGHGGFLRFGHINQTVSADVSVSDGEEVVLRFARTKEDIFRLRMRRGRKFTVNISNTPITHRHGADDSSQGNRHRVEGPNEPSHFQYFYMLFNVPPAQRYDLRSSQEIPPGEFTSDIAQPVVTAHTDEALIAGPPALGLIGAPSPFKCGMTFLGLRTTPLD